jgi:plasmid stability protein
MAQLIVRNLEDEVVQALKERAARLGRSVEEEHRALLRAELLVPRTEDPKQVLMEMPDLGDDFEFERQP